MTSFELPNDFQRYIAISRYARWIEDKNRRETWPETVQRYFDHVNKWLDKNVEEIPQWLKDDLALCHEHILTLKNMPSMRALMTAGKALEKDAAAGYNCCYVNIDDVRAFDEILYCLTCGVGAGYSVENRYVSKLPDVADSFHPTDSSIVVPDSKIGWATSLRELISLLYAGKIPKIDYSRIRPKGARLKTFGGRASGYEPLKELFDYCTEVFKRAAGRKLKDIECHDIICKIAQVVVVGGVRRSALLSISDIDSEVMRHCKSGKWWEYDGQRALANNSAAYYNHPEVEEFLEELISIIRSKSGERGIFNLFAARAMDNGRRDHSLISGANPCLEILLRSMQFCNLTTCIIRPEDTIEDLHTKVKVAATLGTIQSAWTDFRYLRKAWKKNCEEERLLGVSMTGILGNHLLNKVEDSARDNLLMDLRDNAIEVNKSVAAVLGINTSTAITTVKPEGTVSQLALTSSGIHPWYSDYYIRTIRADTKDPLTQMMIAMGFPHEPDITKPESVTIFSFPMKAPEGAITRTQYGAIDQLKLWLAFKKHWAEHTVSITVYVKPEEWVEVGAFVYKHFKDITGISFLPHSDHVYKQAPYQEITESEYDTWLARMPKSVDWSRLSEFEVYDTTKATQELACAGGSCMLE